MFFISFHFTLLVNLKLSFYTGSGLQTTAGSRIESILKGLAYDYTRLCLDYSNIDIRELIYGYSY